MNAFSALALGLLSLGMVGISWLGWQLLRQNGRLLLRLDELEKRLNELEFGEGEEPEGLPLGSEAPVFELPDLAGESKSLGQYRGQPLLLMFFNPACGFCRELVPKLADLYGVRRQAQRDTALGVGGAGADPRQSAVVAGALQNGSVSLPLVLIISTGDAEANRQLFDEHKVTHPVLLQKETEAAAAYQANGTPSGYLIDAEGKIASGLAIGAEALLKIANEPRDSRDGEAQTSSPQSLSNNGHGEDESLVTSAATSRFSNRSLARSKIKRDGLKAGTPAPDFRLPRLDGHGELTLSKLRGWRVLLVFSSPGCGPCNTLGPELEKFHREQERRKIPPSPRPSPPGEGEPPAATVPARGSGVKGARLRGEISPRPCSPSGNGEPTAIEVVMISRGEPGENRAKVKEHGLSFPVVLQQQWEISRLYAMFATPVAYLIDEAGVITRDVAVGTDSILELLRVASQPIEQDHPTNLTAN